MRRRIHPVRVWSDADDAYLHNVVNAVYEQFGKKNVAIDAFWFAGHSQGGMTSHRLVCSDFFKDKVDGMLILSGGRIGRAAPPPDGFFPGGVRPARFASMTAAAERLPTCDFSHIYTTGEHELSAPFPETSPWAENTVAANACVATTSSIRKPVTCSMAHVRTRGHKAWGLLPRGGKAEVFEYPDCKDGRVVADVVRMDKGHTEGLEPNVTEQLVKLMVAAKKTRASQE